jgi:hypothetical protein
VNAIGFALLLGVGGTFVGALWTFAVGIGGAPGLAMERRHTNLIPTWGLVLTVAGQLYVALCFVAFVVALTRHHLAGQSGFGTWVAWAAAWFVSSVTVWAALKDAAQAEVRNVQHGGAVFTALFAEIGFFPFVFAPGTMSPLWGWVPRF